MHITKKNTLLASLCLLPVMVSAAEYSVQVGAFKHYDEAKFTELEKYGGLHAIPTSSGLTRVRIGKFSTHDEAVGAQNSIRKNGYADAYVVRVGRSSVSRVASTRTKEVSRVTAIEPASGTVRRVIPHNLTAEETRMGVYLDGQFRIKNGKQFMTLEEFRKLSAQ